MKRASVSQVKSRLSAYLKDVQRGETVLIFDRDRPVARLEPVNRKDIPDDERTRELVRLGIVTAPKGRLDVKAFLAMPGLPPGVDAVRAVLEEREESPW
jgi:antitoxin (DNA-binding transcriptional repressor) of toxin-antitoxin stability system